MKIKILVTAICLAAASSVSGQSSASKLRLVSEVNDGKSGFVYLDGKLVTLMSPGKNWEIEMPNRLLDPIIPKNVEVRMCDMFVVKIAAPPSWAMSVETAGADAITSQFMESAPVPFEVSKKAAGMLTFLESRRHPDFDNMRIRLIEWIRQTNESGTDCYSAVSLSNPLAGPKNQTFYIRGSRTNGYRLEK